MKFEKYPYCSGTYLEEVSSLLQKQHHKTINLNNKIPEIEGKIVFIRIKCITVRV